MKKIIKYLKSLYTPQGLEGCRETKVPFHQQEPIYDLRVLPLGDGTCNGLEEEVDR